MNKTILRLYTPDDRQGFESMLYEYFNQDLHEELTTEHTTAVATQIEHEMSVYPMYLYILTFNDDPIGFVLFQIDTPENPWGYKPGWGFIREMYVHRAVRRRGAGRAMMNEVFKFYQSAGVHNVYLTVGADEAQKFWQSLGFRDSGDICPGNDLPFFTREGGM